MSVIIIQATLMVLKWLQTLLKNKAGMNSFCF